VTSLVSAVDSGLAFEVILLTDRLLFSELLDFAFRSFVFRRSILDRLTNPAELGVDEPDWAPLPIA
jgi:hypothetical protein